MNLKKKITFISDTPPLKSKGSGISVLLFNILDALEDSYDLSVVTFCRETSAKPEEVINDNAKKKIHICDSFYLKLYGIVRFGILKKIIQFVSFLLSLPYIIQNCSGNDSVFITVVGASIRPVYKAWILMKLAPKSKHCLYMVDDLELINKRYGNRFELFLISIFLGRTIKQSDVLMTISDGLRGLYFNQFNKTSLVFLPHYKKVSPLVNKVPNNIEFVFLFTGGLNLLYNDSLKLIAAAIDEINNSNIKTPIIKLIIQTYSSYDDFIASGFNPDRVAYLTTSNRNDLLNVYNQCNCFLVPYSFEENDIGLVTTSFPQKVAEIIQYGKPILAFGPQYGSVIQFFQNNQLNYICNDPDIIMIKQAILNIIDNYSAFETDAYEKAYKEFLSAERVNQLFDSVINQLI